MKKYTTNWFTQIGTKQLENLTTVVNETLIVDLNNRNGKSFTAADLWNIQRQSKNRIQKRIFV